MNREEPPDVVAHGDRPAAARSAARCGGHTLVRATVRATREQAVLPGQAARVTRTRRRVHAALPDRDRRRFLFPETSTGVAQFGRAAVSKAVRCGFDSCRPCVTPACPAVLNIENSRVDGIECLADADSPRRPGDPERGSWVTRLFWEQDVPGSIPGFRTTRGCSSVGRALVRQTRGQGFDPPLLHAPAREAQEEERPVEAPEVPSSTLGAGTPHKTRAVGVAG
jgi:hypothetical protein